jgi:hypothetical protein
MVEHGWPALRVAARGHFADGLVVQQDFGGLRAAQIESATVETDLVLSAGPVTKRGDPPIDGDATIADPLFDATTRAVSCARKQLLQSFTHRVSSITNRYMGMPSPASCRQSYAPRVAAP